MASRRKPTPGRSSRRPAPSAPGSARSSGILCHLTSLPGPHGSGDLGPSAHAFLKYLASAGQVWWQMLPVGPPGRGNSPYDSESSFAGSPWLVSLERLCRDGWLRKSELRAPGSLGDTRVDYAGMRRFREKCLRQARERFEARGGFQSREFVAFCQRAHLWLDDFALFCALRAAHRGTSWVQWEPELSQREPRALERAEQALRDETRFHRFVQYVFERQWNELRTAAAGDQIGLLGDVPMFVAHDSAEVWANPEVFYLDSRGHPTVVAGVPPDCFSRTGQLWGNPIYRWGFLAMTSFGWWVNRLASVLDRFDAVRLDHFIGFHRYWEVPGRARTAMRGRFVLVPGSDLLETASSQLGGLPLVAEDLGLLVPEVTELRERLGLPGMRVLQFGFGDGPEDRDHLPHRYPKRLVAYTGTHDNDTLMGWFQERAPRGDAKFRDQLARRRERVLRYAGSDGREIHWDLIRLVLMSPADTAIFPLQDLLGLDSRARMNTPGTAHANWEWRVRSDQLEPAVAKRMRSLVESYDRLPPPGDAVAPGVVRRRTDGTKRA